MHAYAESFWKKAQDLIAIDVRSLALFRIGIALVVLVDLADRVRDAEAMYSDGGVLSIENAKAYFNSPWRWSMHFWDGSTEWQLLLFAAAGLFAMAMLVGYNTRIAVVGSWLLMASLHHRMPLVNNGGDMLLRMMLFWAMFLPLGACWSLDAWRRGKRGLGSPFPGATKGGKVITAATFCIMLQLCLMYWFTGNYKCNHHWYEGDALAKVLTFDVYGRPPAQFFLQFPWLLKALTVGTLALELAGPALAWFPFWNGRVRLAVIASFIAFHLGIELTMTVGMFSFVSISAWFLFLPSSFWDALGHRFTWARLPDAESAPQVTSPKWAHLRQLGLAAACVPLMGYVLLYNTYALGDGYRWVMPASIRWLGDPVALKQKWNMFGVPPRRTGWYVAKATLANGEVVDILNADGEFDTKKPADPAAKFPNHRWRKLFRMVTTKKKQPQYARGMMTYMRTKWNHRHDEDHQIVSIDLLYFTHSTGLKADIEDIDTEVVIHLDAEADSVAAR